MILTLVILWVLSLGGLLLVYNKYKKAITHYELQIDQKEKEHKLVIDQKNTFFAAMSHEIRTPLNGIIVATNLLKDKNLDQEKRELINIIYNSGNILINVINDILDISKIESGKMNLDYKSFFLKDILKEISFFFEPQFNEKNLYFHYKIDEELKEAVYSDPTRFKQIIFNIVGNALKFTHHGGVSIHISKKEDLINLDITDTGIGIKQEDIPKLFDAYTQAKNQDAKIGGTGLGLNICKNLSQLLGGDMKIESTYGKGSKFSVTIKYEQNKYAQVSNDLKQKERSNTSKDYSDLKVLLVDDNEVNRKVAGMILKKKGVIPDIAENGQIAVDKASKENFDIIFMDLKMPVMNGIEASEKLIETIPYNKLPLIVALSANAFKEDKDECFNAGMNGFMTKPVNLNELDQFLDKALSRQTK